MTDLGDAWAQHDRWAGDLVAALPTRALYVKGGPRQLLVSHEWVEQLCAWPPEIAGGGLLLIVRRCSEEQLVASGSERPMTRYRRRWVVSRPDALIAARLACDSPDLLDARWLLKLVVVMLQQALGKEPVSTTEASDIRELLASVDSRARLATADRNKLRAALLACLPAANDDPEAGVYTAVIAEGDLWSRHVIRELRAVDTGAGAVSALLSHLAMASGSKPSVAWLSMTSSLLATDECVAAVRMLLQGVLDAERGAAEQVIGERTQILDAGNTDVLRGAAWATIAISADWVVPTLRDVAIRTAYMNGWIGWMSWEKTPNACLLALGRKGTPESVVALQEIAARAKHAGIRKRIAAALEVAGSAAGLTAGQVAERAVPTGGLDALGSVSWSAGEHVARATLDDESKLLVQWQRGEAWSPTPPADWATTQINAVKAAVKDVRTAVIAERRRVEALFAADRTWAYADWSRYYLEHPITGRLTRRLIWRFDHDGSIVSGVPDGAVLHCAAADIALPTDGRVTLWQPAGASAAEIDAWRALVFAGRLRQPFKQAFREVYVLSADERGNASYSNRFAAHILRYQQLFALCKEREWVTNYLGFHDGGFEGCARRDLGDAGITAAFDHVMIEPAASTRRVALSRSERIWFYRTKDRSRTPLTLADVPPLVFSEALRDIDLFVSATSIATDPDWSEPADDETVEYWRRASVAPLTEVALVRRDALVRILPTLKIADRVDIDEAFVRVRGRLGSYRVHIGSANVFVLPDDRLIVIAGRKLRAVPMLPFTGDDVLTLIISKLHMLAADDKIADPLVREQLGK